MVSGLLLKPHHHRYILGTLLILWALMQLAAADLFSMRTSVDTAFYQEGADALLHFRFPEGRGVMYISYMLLLAFIQGIGLNHQVIILIHFAANIVAILCSYKLAMKLTRNSDVALLAPLCYVLWFKFQQWNLIIYTDALFSHMVVISVFLLAYAHSKKLRLLLIIVLLFTMFIRPTGMGLLFALCCFGIYKFATYPALTRAQKLALVTLLAVVFLFVLNSVLYNFVDRFIYGFQIAEVIYPRITLYINPPASLHIPDKDLQPVIKLALFLMQNAGFILKISLLKAALFIGHMKPYYSTLHNSFIACFLYPIYILAIIGSFKSPWNNTTIIIVSFILFQILTVMITSVNWDGRLLLPVLPLVFILAAMGLQRCMPGANHR